MGGQQQQRKKLPAPAPPPALLTRRRRGDVHQASDVLEEARVRVTLCRIGPHAQQRHAAQLDLHHVSHRQEAAERRRLSSMQGC